MLLYAFNKPVFVIDAYTKRIFSRIGIKDVSYDALQELFHSKLKKDVFNEYHALLIEHAKRHCKKKPVCKDCPVYSICKRHIN